MQIYINKNGQQLGPFDEGKVREMLKNGQLLSTDYGIKEGQQRWTQLSGMFPGQKSSQAKASPNLHASSPIQPNLQLSNIPTVPQPKPSSSKGLTFGLIGCGGMLLLGFIGLFAFFGFSGGNKSSVAVNNSNQTELGNSNANVAASPANIYYTDIVDNVKELAALKPPLKLEKKGVLRGKTVVLDVPDRASEYMISFRGFSSYYTNETELTSYGLTKEMLPSKRTEIDTLVQIVCGKGREIGQYGPSSAYVPAYANSCKISIIDYKKSVVVFQKIIENAKRPKVIEVTKNDYEYVLEIPDEAVKKYIKELPKE
jgi:GYF domain 2